jgi:hypothetical protein
VSMALSRLAWAARFRSIMGELISDSSGGGGFAAICAEVVGG